ncbi:MAG: hypothetical protein JXR94_10290 [Candidatus Hydrogenedentes bacterium]|nr:hypothetical protein [Candidatus Hydrogenedentota bacterium]
MWPSIYPLMCLCFALLIVMATGAHAAEAPASPPPNAAEATLWTTNVREHGAAGDANTDDTKAFQAALDAAAPTGGIVFAPAGTYRLGGALNVPQGVTLRGVWESPHHADIGKGTMLYATGSKGNEDGPPLITLNQSSGIHGVTIFYPEQNVTAVVPYPWCIQGKGMHGSVVNVTLVNPYKGIDFGTHANELHYISNVFGQPLKVGIFIDKTTDIGRIENVHFNPHSWARAAHPTAEAVNQNWVPFQQYLARNFTGFLIGKTDWEYMRDCFCIFAKVGFHFVQTQAGAPNVMLTQCGADLSPLAVQVDATQEHAGIAFENGQFMGTVNVGPENRGPVKLTNCGFWPMDQTNEQVIVRGKGTVTLTACHFAGWGRQSASAPCVRIEEGAALIHACDFVDVEKTQIYIGPDAVAASVVGCRFRDGERIEDRSLNSDVMLGMNVAR